MYFLFEVPQKEIKDRALLLPKNGLNIKPNQTQNIVYVLLSVRGLAGGGGKRQKAKCLSFYDNQVEHRYQITYTHKIKCLINHQTLQVEFMALLVRASPPGMCRVESKRSKLVLYRLLYRVELISKRCYDKKSLIGTLHLSL